MNTPAHRTTPQGADAPWRWHSGVRYGLLGLPLAFVALPLYVHLPNYYATTFGMPLALLGALLLLARLFDAFTDPLLGRLSDRLFAHSPQRVLWVGAVSAGILALGMAALFFPQVEADQLPVWIVVALLVTYTAFSQLNISYQSWAARLGGSEPWRARIVAWREGFALLGVVMASVLPALAGWNVWLWTFVVALSLGWWSWTRALRPAASIPDGALTALPTPRTDLLLPWRRAAFRKLMLVFVLSGLASAMPATLVLFFIQDRLQAAAYEPVFLATYFLTAALSMPLWVRAVRHVGLVRAWLAGMLLAVVTFMWAATLGAGDVWAYWAICALSGLALGADLALPSALLAGVIAQHNDQGHSEGAYFGWWNLATKLNLALAAGIALPLLGWWGFSPGASTDQGLQALTWAYAVLPCAIKLIAAALLYQFFVRTPLESSP